MNKNYLSKNIFSILLLLAGALILLPKIGIHPELSTGDNGSNFYAIQQTAQGATPYKDYWWVYGPLMPYYYGFLYNIFGGTIQSILMGKQLLIFLSGIIFYLTLKYFARAPIAFLGTVWLWTFGPNFSYTVNHDGAITLLLAIAYCLIAFIHKKNSRYIAIALLLSLICSLIKLNIGLSALLAIFICCFIIDKYAKTSKERVWQRLYLPGAFIIPCLIFAVYWIFLRGLEGYEIRQCLPYFSEDRPEHTPFMEILFSFTKFHFQNIISSAPNFIFGLILWFSMVQTLRQILTRHKEDATQKLFLSIITLSIFLVFSLHELFLSGVAYRIYWILPFQFLLMFIFIATAIDPLSKFVKGLLVIALLTVASLQTVNVYRVVQAFHKPHQFLAQPNAQIYVANSPEWINTVSIVTDYLNKNLTKNETFLAIPYDPLYYYLTQKKSPTRLLIFFDHINIPLNQEEKMIRDMIEKKTKYVLISNRSDSSGLGLGTFGKSYCVRLADYINKNYVLTGTVGPWEGPSGVTQNHAIKIYMKKP